MRSLKLNSGATIPELGFGTWLAAPGVVQTSVEAAIKTGFRHIDCAAIYGNEKEVGAAFKNAFASVRIPSLTTNYPCHLGCPEK